MNIFAFFTNGGLPASGLVTTVKIIEAETGSVVVNWEEMTEISDGWYKYDFPYDYTKEYVAVCDGGSTLSDAERYVYSGKDNSNHEIKYIVWDAKVSDFQTPGSFGQIVKQTSDNLKRALGLLHENIYIDTPVYDDNSNLISARVRIYSNNTSVGTNNDIIGTYLITSDASGRGTFNSWSQIII
jgi:glycosylphosphatidylinositol transamidase (GPIT) subunit GPI8